MTWPTSQVATGDLITATQLNALPVKIASASGAAASYDFTSIPSYWTHLLIVCFFRTDGAGSKLAMNIRFNNDSAANYDHNFTTASETFAATSISAANWVNAASAAANLFSDAEIWIPNYANANENKMLHASGASKFGVAAGNTVNAYGSGFWRSNAAINRVTIFPGSGSFIADSRADVYGWGA